MRLPASLKPLGGTQWRYCVKVGLAAALGYLLTQGNQNQYAVYSAFTAALIVGANFGEDLAASGNRVKGTLVGMLAGMAVSAFLGPSALAVGVSVGLTALIAMALGWGVAVARVGVTLCIITLAFHSDDALRYDLLRAVNTLIGIAVGLAVSFLVWRVRARDEVGRAKSAVLDAGIRLLDAYAAGERDLRPLELRLYDALAAMVKAGRDGRLERRMRLDADAPDARALEVLQVGLDLLAAALAAEGHGDAGARPPLESLRSRLEGLRAAPGS
jgi:uncharacterized membrane protein YccC